MAKAEANLTRLGKISLNRPRTLCVVGAFRTKSIVPVYSWGCETVPPVCRRVHKRFTGQTIEVPTAPLKPPIAAVTEAFVLMSFPGPVETLVLHSSDIPSFRVLKHLQIDCRVGILPY